MALAVVRRSAGQMAPVYPGNPDFCVSGLAAENALTNVLIHYAIYSFYLYCECLPVANGSGTIQAARISQTGCGPMADRISRHLGVRRDGRSVWDDHVLKKQGTDDPKSQLPDCDS